MSAQSRRPDPCLTAVLEHPETDVRPLLDFLIKFTGLAKRTPPERILLAVAEELEALCGEAAEGLGAFAAAGEVALALVAARAAFDPERPESIAFPREVLLEQRASDASDSRLASELDRWLEKHSQLERRVRWLLDGTSRASVAELDPIRDSDRITCSVLSAFRVESRVLELLAVNRIAQSAALALFVRSTRESEQRPVARFYDTYSLFANYFEWGETSRRGRAAIDRINGIHARFHLPADGMKYILLQSAFTWLDGAAQIGHRPLTEIERRGLFHAHIRMGRAMKVPGLSDDYAEMYGWYRDFNRRHRDFQPLKRDSFETFVGNSLGEGVHPGLEEGLLLAARVAMDADYRSALGYAVPAQEEIEKVRSVFFTLGALVEALPRAAYLRSLQNNPAHSRYTRPHELGVSARSPHLPGLQKDGELPPLSWEEIGRHRSEADLWIVVDGDVYDLTGWARLHPGGLEPLLKWAGRDASAAFHAAPHSAATQVLKRNYLIGRAAPEPDRAISPRCSKETGARPVPEPRSPPP